jgi:DNA-binding CsgD family transcriptional regulator
LPGEHTSIDFQGYLNGASRPASGRLQRCSTQSGEAGRVTDSARAAITPRVGFRERETEGEGEGVSVDGHLEVWTASGRTLLPLVFHRCTVGSSPQCDLVVDDSSVSRTHLLLEHLGGAWFVEDLGSRNGTYLNGHRITGRRVVRPGDELRLGFARAVMRGLVSGGGAETKFVNEPPTLTPRERDVLVSLCRPLRSGDPFTEPASIREIAAALFVSDAAVKQHLGNLFQKFGVVEGDRRRLRLANAALSSGAITLGDLQSGGCCD